MSSNRNVLITGASGFLGSHLVKNTRNRQGICVTAAVRRIFGINSCSMVSVGDIDQHTDWSDALSKQHVVIHVAGLAHVTDDQMEDPLTAFRRVNVDGTLNFARQAAETGVKRFIFVSSIGVNGNHNRFPFTEDDRSNPLGAYAQSKWEAELGLWAIGREMGMEIVIVRPPLIYGPNAPGNFGILVRMVERGVPLPLGAVRNKRSLVAMDNLVDMIITCIDHPGAANETFLVSDGEDLSTTQLLQGVAEAMGKPSRLITVPVSLLQFGATLLGKKAVAQRLLGSLQVDISHTQKCLNWTPPLTVKQGLQRCFPNQQD
jgi:nucleoside-diphosphate-sugar epimerase